MRTVTSEPASCSPSIAARTRWRPSPRSASRVRVFAQGAYDDTSKDELSHYYKFLTLQSELDGYTQDYINAGKQLKNTVAPLPAAPSVPASQFTDGDLGTFVVPALDNPVASNFGDGRKELVDIADGLYQYMLIMTETIYRVPSNKQKIYFNRTMHQSMIWVLDKFLQALRTIPTANGGNTLSATFANIPLGDRKDAFTTLKKMVTDFNAKYGTASWFTTAEMGYLLTKIAELPDVGVYWGSAPPALDPSYLASPSAEQGAGTDPKTPTARTKIVETGPYADTPKWPLTPPMDSDLPSGAARHACMGLNSCENQGRTSSNECAGQGYCSTALSYNPVDSQNPTATDHTCHVLNDCHNQGGCGLYGTQHELANRDATSVSRRVPAPHRSTLSASSPTETCAATVFGCRPGRCSRKRFGRGCERPIPVCPPPRPRLPAPPPTRTCFSTAPASNGSRTTTTAKV